jgi:hypothetical protein
MSESDQMLPTEPFREEREQLLEHIEHLAAAARELPRLSEEERDALRQRILGFLRGTLGPARAGRGGSALFRSGQGFSASRRQPRP